jgi:heat shock protein HtpX
MDNLFSTHPATENRIAALMAMEQQTGDGEPAQHTSGPWSKAGARRRSGPWD